MLSLDVDMQELEQWADDLDHDLNLIERFVRGRGFRNAAKRILESSFQEIWATRGAAIRSDWNGRTLVKSGRLRRVATSGLTVTANARGLEFSVDVPYASFVNDIYRFEGITPRAQDQLGDMIGRMLKSMGKLDWNIT